MFCVYILSVLYAYLVPAEDQKGVLYPLELELLSFVPCTAESSLSG